MLNMSLPEDRDGFKVLAATEETVTITLFKDRWRVIADSAFCVT